MLETMPAFRSGFADLFTLFLLVEMIRRLDQNRLRFALALLVAVFAIGKVAELSLRFQLADVVADTAESAQRKFGTSRQSSKPVPPENRERYERFTARMAYYNSGELLHITDAAGTRQLFAPTQDDVRRRERWVVTDALFRERVRALWAGFGYQLGVFVVALLFTAVLVVEQRQLRRSAA